MLRPVKPDEMFPPKAAPGAAKAEASG